MKKLILILCVLLTSFSCKNDEVATNEVNFDITLKGINEVPANASAATGTFLAVYKRDTKILKYTITYSGITPTAWHIHKGASTATGAIVFNFGSTFSTPYVNQTVALSSEQEKDLLAGNYYVNIHSALYAAGEIRGQLVK
jgi:hypothetical protein